MKQLKPHLFLFDPSTTMSVNCEFQFMAMLEGHELEKELLSVVSILFMIDSPWRIGFINLTGSRVSVQLICNCVKRYNFK